MGLILSYIIIFLLAVYAGFRLRKIWNQDKNTIAPFLILIPKGKSNSKTSHHSQKDIDLSNELYRRLIEFKIPFSLEVVVESIGEEIKFYIFASRRYERKIERIISSLWPNAETPEVDYELWSTTASNEEFKAGEHTQVSYLGLEKSYAIPLQIHSDIFSKILKNLSNLKILGEAVSIQWIIKPAHPQIKHDVGASIEKIYAGSTKSVESHSPEDFLLTPETAKTLEWKISQPLIATNCRIVTHSISPRRTTQISDGLRDLFQNSIKTSQSNHLKFTTPKAQNKHLQLFLDKELEASQEMIINTKELADLFHLPGKNTPPKVKTSP